MKPEIPRPKQLRKGQMLFNFFEWLHKEKGLPTNESHRMADPFNIDDKDFDKFYREYLKYLNGE